MEAPTGLLFRQDFRWRLPQLVAGLEWAVRSGVRRREMARNPGAAAAIRGALILGLVLIESLALYVIVIIFVKVV